MKSWTDAYIIEVWSWGDKIVIQNKGTLKNGEKALNKLKKALDRDEKNI